MVLLRKPKLQRRIKTITFFCQLLFLFFLFLPSKIETCQSINSNKK
jgi:hypothetical protein